jgi:hypothetical protein
MVFKCGLEFNVRRLVRVLPAAPAFLFLAAQGACGDVPVDEPVPAAAPGGYEGPVSNEEGALIEKRATESKCCTSCGSALPACLTCAGNCSAIDGESVTCNATGELRVCPTINVPAPPKCGAAFTETYGVPGTYYTYPLKNLSVDCMASGSSVSVSVQANDVPNRFAILDSSNNLVASSEWLGTASYSGVWGDSLNNSGYTILNFTYYSGPYYLRVETQIQSDGSWVDAWSALVSCQCRR